MTEYTGGCHCGNIAYTVEGEFNEAMICNCSHCSMKGFRLAFVPASQFKLTKGEGKWTTYHFNKGAIDHNFCKTCGVESFAFGKMPDGSDIAAINLNCIDALGAASLPVQEVDGKSY